MDLRVKCFSFLSHKTDFKYLMIQPHVNVKAITFNFIQQVCLQNFLIKTRQFLITHGIK